jgi:hypothetical protein
MILKTSKEPDSGAKYTRIDNRLICDEDLSPLAKLALIYLLSKSDDWTLVFANLKRYLQIGDNKLKAILAELKAEGYINRTQAIDPQNNRFGRVQTDIFEIPQLNPSRGLISAPTETAPTETAPTETAPAEIKPLNNNGQLTTEEQTIDRLTTDNNGDIGQQVENFSSLGIDSPEEKLLFELVTQARGIASGKKGGVFPNLALKQKYSRAAGRLNGNLRTAILAGLAKPGIPLTGLINYVAKFEPPPESDAPLGELGSKIAAVCKIDLAVASDKTRAVAETEQVFEQNGYSLADMVGFEIWWYESYWRGQQGSPPSLKELRAVWGQFKAARPANGKVVAVYK